MLVRIFFICALSWGSGLLTQNEIIYNCYRAVPQAISQDVFFEREQVINNQQFNFLPYAYKMYLGAFLLCFHGCVCIYTYLGTPTSCNRHICATLTPRLSFEACITVAAEGSSTVMTRITIHCYDNDNWYSYHRAI